MNMFRLSLFTGQPLGVSSLESGQLEVIMDRRLMQDDNRGVGQGVKDNVLTPESFVILVEYWNKDGAKKSTQPLSYLSLAAHRLSWELLHRAVVRLSEPCFRRYPIEAGHVTYTY